eukprot:TRINITY_DN45195_c0_g1_i1.p1 TRINITY_DN45195_c0_g1~~TRINITY_DN45195_c0_g1_i1.p1  ORF type:complete len:221 (-),score=35.16 TRINITY_DN45195_c0_g1_i1:185-847(-)
MSASKPDFLQPAFDLGSTAGSLPKQRPPKLPSSLLAENEQFGTSVGSSCGARGSPTPSRGTPTMTPPKIQPHAPSSLSRVSSRGLSPRRASSSGAGGGSITPRASSCSDDHSALPNRPASSLGVTGSLGSLSDDGGASTRKQEMLRQGYLPSEDYIGIMALNKTLREHHKSLRAELVTFQVENERLRMEEAFLRGCVLQAGLTPPPEVPAVVATNPRPSD